MEPPVLQRRAEDEKAVSLGHFFASVRVGEGRGSLFIAPPDALASRG
jgi:hypothetical protein